MRIPLAMSLIADLCVALGVAPATQCEGCWEHQVDEDWWIFLNAHGHPVPTSKGIEVPPYTCVVHWREWPAGMFDVSGGSIAAGEAANEQTFIAALQAAIAKIKPA